MQIYLFISIEPENGSNPFKEPCVKDFFRD